MWNRVGNHLRDSQDFVAYAKTDPHKSKVILGSILGMMVLFLVGVVYPLGLLPVPLGRLTLTWSSVPGAVTSARGLLLLIVGGIFVAFGLWFLWMYTRLGIDQTKVAELAKYEDHGDYSPYFHRALTTQASADRPLNQILP